MKSNNNNNNNKLITVTLLSFEEGESLVDCMCEVLRGTMVAMFVRQKMQQYNKRNNGQDQKN